MAGEPFLIDTNILLRLSKHDDPHHKLIRAAVGALANSDSEICYTAKCERVLERVHQTCQSKRLWSVGPRDRPKAASN